jgi:hypothetical protein
MNSLTTPALQTTISPTTLSWQSAMQCLPDVLFGLHFRRLLAIDTAQNPADERSSEEKNNQRNRVACSQPALCATLAGFPAASVV